MISTSNRLWYAEPVPNPVLNGTGLEPIFVTREKLPRPSEPLVGTVVTPTDLVIEDGTLWYSVDGRWVEGHVVCAELPRREMDVLILFGDDDSAPFGIGRFQRASSGVALVMDVVRSDGFRFPVGMPVRVTQWVPAASWARELMPLPDEPERTTNLRIEAAQWKYKRRRAEAVVWREAKDRDWTGELDTLKLNGLPLGSPQWYPLVTSTVTTYQTVPVTDMNDYQSGMVDKLKSHSFQRAVDVQARVVIPLSVVGRNSYDPDEIMPHSQASNIVKSCTHDYSLTLGDFNVEPLLGALIDPTPAA